MNEAQKTIRAEELLQILRKNVEKANSALIVIERGLRNKNPTRLRETGEELRYATREIVRITRVIEPRNGRCARTCPELCPNHQQMKIGGG